MGREVKRVALDFDWPLKKVWDGYLNNHYRECPKCRAGYSKAYDIIAKYINGLMWDSEGQKNESVAKITEFLAGRPGNRSFFGHGSCDAWSAVKKIGEIAGLPEEWSTCSHCDGSGVDPEIKKEYDEWEATEPPEGEGYQMWETTSEGSPISPVFQTPEDLAEWLEANKASSFGSQTCSYDQWLDFIRGPGWAPSAIMKNGVLSSGVCSA